MNIRMYNVGFGDCFLLYDDSEGLLIDFGSDTPETYLDSVADNIVAITQNKKLSLLLTHFHNDHINGCWKTNLSARRKIADIYLPDILNLKNIGGKRLSFAQAAILSDIFSSIALQTRPIEITLESLLLNLSTQKSNFHFIQKGDTFSWAGNTYQVLWPSLSNSDLSLYENVEKAAMILLEKMGLIVTENADAQPSSIEDIQKKFVNLGAIDDYIMALLDGFSRLGNDNANWEQTLTEIQVAHENMTNQVVYKLGNLAINQEISDGFFPILTEELKKQLRTSARSLRHQANRTSIVFQDKAVKGRSNLLMTGDITISELKKIMSGTQNTYRVIKAPHHATKSHFPNFLPRCDAILASNGPPRANHSRWGKISYHYGPFYGSHKGSQMICSNTRCELYDLQNTSNCAMCPNPNSNWTDYTF